MTRMSTYCFFNYLDLQNLATMFKIVIYVFEYSSSGNMIPCWQQIHPNLELSKSSPYANFKEDHGVSYMDMWLYNEKSVHFNLLVPGYLCLATDVEMEERQLECQESDSKEADGSTDANDIEAATNFSLIVFKTCPRAAGRPKKKRFGA